MMDDQAKEAAPETPSITAEDAGKILFLIDCAVRFTPQPNGGLNMAVDALGLAQKLSAIQQATTGEA